MQHDRFFFSLSDWLFSVFSFDLLHLTSAITMALYQRCWHRINRTLIQLPFNQLTRAFVWSAYSKANSVIRSRDYNNSGTHTSATGFSFVSPCSVAGCSECRAKLFCSWRITIRRQQWNLQMANWSSTNSSIHCRTLNNKSSSLGHSLVWPSCRQLIIQACDMRTEHRRQKLDVTSKSCGSRNPNESRGNITI